MASCPLRSQCQFISSREIFARNYILKPEHLEPTRAKPQQAVVLSKVQNDSVWISERGRHPRRGSAQVTPTPWTSSMGYRRACWGKQTMLGQREEGTWEGSPGKSFFRSMTINPVSKLLRKRQKMNSLGRNAEHSSLRTRSQGWRDDSTDGSCRPPGFNSQYPHGGGS